MRGRGAEHQRGNMNMLAERWRGGAPYHAIQYGARLCQAVAFQATPDGTLPFQVIPGHTKFYHDTSSHTRAYQTLPDSARRFLTIPSHTITYQMIPGRARGT
jgi:hypothetical protein